MTPAVGPHLSDQRVRSIPRKKTSSTAGATSTVTTKAWSVVEAGVVALLAGYVDIFIGEYVHQMGQVDRYKVQEQPGGEYGEEHQQADYPDNRTPPVAGWYATDKQPHIDPVPRSLPQDPGYHEAVEPRVYNERLKEGVKPPVRATDKEVGEYEHTNQYGDSSEHPEDQAAGPDPVKRVVRVGSRGRSASRIRVSRMKCRRDFQGCSRIRSAGSSTRCHLTRRRARAEFSYSLKATAVAHLRTRAKSPRRALYVSTRTRNRLL